MIEKALVSAALTEFLPKQRWYGAKNQALKSVDVVLVETMWTQWPAALRVEADAVAEDGTSETYHIVIGLRPPGQPAVFLEGKPESVLGEFETEQGPAYGYDGLRDPEIALRLLTTVAPDAPPASRVRPVGGEQSNTSLIYDDRLIFKMFRRLSDEANLDLEVTRALTSIGFTHIAQVVGQWRSEAADLGILQEFLSGGVEGWALATTSLRDLYERGVDPAEAGGDFAGESARLGEMTAEMHHALAEALGTFDADVTAWARLMDEQLNRASLDDAHKQAASRVFASLGRLRRPGPSIRVHGDYHLAQVMRTDLGWHVLDFEGEPSRPAYERRQPMSPLKDVAGMLRSLHYVSLVVLAERDDQRVELAQAWEKRNRRAFLDGYVAVAHRLGGLLPDETKTFELLLKAFEIDKAVYELAYEQNHRPDWARIPESALARLLG